jgi:16S rRNA (uracil1498-N3)-methyltransferase
MARRAIAPTHPRFYCAQLPHPRLGEPNVWLDVEQSRHLRRVLRLPVGAGLELFDGAGGLASASVLAYGGQRAQCQVHHVAWHDRPPPRLTLATALPKGPAAETMVNQLSQLGVDRVIPLQTERSVVHPRPQKQERFAKAAIESAKQSGRLFLMSLDELTPLNEAMQESADVKLVLSTDGAVAEPDRLALQQATHVMLYVGPEGGFSDNEMTKLQQAGAQPWTIAETVLRIETAALSAATLAGFLTASPHTATR